MKNPITHVAFAAVAALGLSLGSAFAAGSHAGADDDGGHRKTNGHHADDIGKPGDPASADRTVTVRLGEMFFEPGSMNVKMGETVRFVIRNEGEAVHEFNVGTAQMHMSHADEMVDMMDSGFVEVDRINRKLMAANGMMHSDPNSLLLAPGESGEITWTFSTKADLEMSCNVPGHRESGMLGKIKIDQ